MKNKPIVESFSGFLKIKESRGSSNFYLNSEIVEVEVTYLEEKFTKEELISFLGEDLYEYYFGEESESFSNVIGENSIKTEVTAEGYTWYDRGDHWNHPPEGGVIIKEIEIVLPENLRTLDVPESLRELYDRFVELVKELAEEYLRENLEYYI